MGRKIKVGKFEATLPAVHTLPVFDAVRVTNAEPEAQPFIIAHIIMKHLTYLQRKRFESLTVDEFTKVLQQWLGTEEGKK